MFFTCFQFYFMEYNEKQDMQKWLFAFVTRILTYWEAMSLLFLSSYHKNKTEINLRQWTLKFTFPSVF